MEPVIDVYFEEEIVILVNDPDGFDQEQAWKILESNSIGFTGISKAGG